MNRLLRSLAVLPLVCLLPACSAPAPDEPETAAKSDAIIGGVTDQNYTSVVLLTLPGGYQCTGSLIAPKLVLTARHCVSQNVTEGIGCDIYGNSTNGDHVGNDYAASGIEVRTGTSPTPWQAAAAVGTQIFHPAGKNLCNNDIALVVLNKAVAGTPMKVRLDYGPQMGELTTAVGYGITSDTNYMSSGTRRRRGSVPVITVGQDWNEITGANELAAGQSICSGDSGGPLVSAGGGIIGVASRSAECAVATNHPKFTRVDSHKALIMQAFAAAGASPTLETGTGATVTKKQVGEGPCNTGAECVTSLCKTGAGSICTNFCDNTPCPVGTLCQDSSTIISGTTQNLKLCIPLSSSNACDQCRNTQCVNVTSTCLNNAACKTLLACVDACADPTCVDGCIAANPGGAADYDSLRYCTCAGSCVGSCGHMCSGSGTGGAGGGAGVGGAAGTPNVGGAPTGGFGGAAGGVSPPPTGSSSGSSGGCSVSPVRSELPAWMLGLLVVLARRRRR